MRKGGIYLALGDSITWSIPTDTTTKGDQLYAFRVRDAIRANYGPVRLINKGIGGINSNEFIRTMAWSLRVVPDLVTIGLGINDATNNSVSVPTYQANLELIVDKIRLLNPAAHIIFCTPSQTTDAARTPYIQPLRDGMIASGANKSIDVCRFDLAFTSGQVATYTVDGVHPTAAGHQLLYNLLWPIVQKGSWLSKLG